MDSVQWGEYRLGDLFIGENGDFDIQRKHINGRGEYVITAGLTNNGILGKTDVEAKIFNSDTITIDMFGNAFYRPYEYKLVTHARVFSLSALFEITYNIGLFISNSLHFLPSLFGYDNMCLWSKIKDIKIQLPTKNGKIDFEFMESFVAELEAQRLAELEAYLTVTGLKDYELTDEEWRAIDMLDDDIWDSIDVVKLFDVNNTKNILARDIVPGSGLTPYLCASAENNSVSSYIDYDDELKDKGNCIFIGGKTFVVSYQEHDFFSNDSHNLALHLIDENKKSRYSHLFLATCVRKSLEHKYSWGDSISNRKIQKDRMTIPFKNGLVDYEFMEIVISAVQKLVIKDVVLWADKKIEATKEIISK